MKRCVRNSQARRAEEEGAAAGEGVEVTQRAEATAAADGGGGGGRYLGRGTRTSGASSLALEVGRRRPNDYKMQDKSRDHRYRSESERKRTVPTRG